MLQTWETSSQELFKSCKFFAYPAEKNGGDVKVELTISLVFASKFRLKKRQKKTSQELFKISVSIFFCIPSDLVVFLFTSISLVFYSAFSSQSRWLRFS
uniref:Uncharacterized protein n=1 Tax=Nelumbo nucifera TaxID=4432 RepID=A0A822ZJD4_NELNU|nr:TPA_asm: hypothetical protein HUJ06_001729 [Nelumbo nucifera]